MTAAERAKAIEHDATCDGIFQPPCLKGSTLWVCDTCSFAIDAAGPIPPIADVPFALTAELSTRKSQQGGLF